MPEAPVAFANRLTELREIKDAARRGPDDAATQRQHDRGQADRARTDRAAARPGLVHRAGGRCAGTAPPASAWSSARPHTDGVVSGWGTVDGRTVFVYAHDFRIFGGALGEAHAQKIHKVMDLAEAAGAPLVSLNDGAGRPDPGGRHRAGRLRRHLPAQHPLPPA